MKLPSEIFCLDVCPGARLVLISLWLEVIEGERAGEMAAHLEGRGPASFVALTVEQVCSATGYSRANVAVHLQALQQLGQIRRSPAIVGGNVVRGWLLTPPFAQRRAA